MRKNEYGKCIAEPGDKIRACGIIVTIDRILYQDFWRDWDIEFIDTDGNYRHWKQYFDKGELIPKKGTKRYYDEYGTDCTDIFRKYGYC